LDCSPIDLDDIAECPDCHIFTHDKRVTSDSLNMLTDVARIGIKLLVSVLVWPDG
jgi:hypothetical protein